jgi:hypothetical protein
MAAYEDSYAPLLGGVSQQVVRERQDTQVHAQDNMTCDPVTNLRRRPGAQFLFAIDFGGPVDPTMIAAWDTTIGGEECQVILNVEDGVVRVLNSASVVVHTSDATEYLVAASAANVRAVTVVDTLYIINMEKVPEYTELAEVVEGTDHGGFIDVIAGAFSKTYRVHIYGGPGVFPFDTLPEQIVTYTTPDGTGGTDAEDTTPQAIASALCTAINLTVAVDGMVATVRGSQVFIRHVGTDIPTSSRIKVTTETGPSYMITSNDSKVRDEADLPLALPDEGDDYLITVGSGITARYYRYDADSESWLESGDAVSPLTMTNGPCTVSYDGTDWEVTPQLFEGRLAGNADNNPDAQFVDRGISGVAEYQGRLVLLSDNIVSMSATNKPLRFFRTTVTSLLESDTIGIGTSGTSASIYRHAVKYANDLVVFSARNQAVVPGSVSAVTPRSAVLLGFSEYTTDTTSGPVQAGRGLLFPVPRSPQFFGVYEMLPNGQVASMYDSTDETPHLPEYMEGACRFAISSSVADSALFGSTTALDTVYVNEYKWDKSEKLQSSWHRWVFPFDIATAYYRGADAVMLFAHGDYLLGATVTARGPTSIDGDRLALMDVVAYADVVNGVVDAPDWLLDFLPTDAEREDLAMAVATGDLAGSAIGYTYEAGVFTTESSYLNGRVAMGFPYTSLVTPTPPMRKDYKGNKISTNKMTLLRYYVSTNNSGSFDVLVQDGGEADVLDDEYGPLTYDSEELELDTPPRGGDSAVVIPARTRAEKTLLTLSTSGQGELNVVGLEYAAQYHEKLKRMRG